MKPAILAVDDDQSVLATLGRDLRRRYAERYQVLRASSGAEALETLRQLALRSDPVALLVSDQRMPNMGGVEFLEQALALYPEAKRVLLTAYADTEAAIRAINLVHAHHYLVKPWEPPEEHLYPVLDDLLEDWQADHPPMFEGVTVIGHQWSAQTHQVKEFLARNLVPYRFANVESDSEALKLLELAGTDPARLPVVLLPDGQAVVAPSNRELAERVGRQTRPGLAMYDLVVIGAGPAGLAAAVYGGSEGLKTLLVESEAPGGQAGTSSKIENYLGFPSGLSGSELTRRAVDQARKFGVEILAPQEVTGLRREDPFRVLTLADGSEISCKALLIASGVAYRTLDVPGAARLTGSGIYYGAANTEAAACQDSVVFVLGAGNSAGQAAMNLARYARSVTLLVRGDDLGKSMSRYLVDRIAETPNVHVRLRTEITRAEGERQLECLGLVDHATGLESMEPADALFVFIGADPCTEWLAEAQVVRDSHGFILSGTDLLQDGRRPLGWNLTRDPFWLETSVPGVFVAGDVRARSIKRVASAVGEGSMAVQFVHQHLASL